MSVLDVFWIFFMLSALQPVIRQRLLDTMRMRKIAQLERDRHSRVILLVHRQETMKFLGFPVMRYIDVNDSEEVLRAIHMTDPDVPLDLVLHTGVRGCRAGGRGDQVVHGWARPEVVDPRRDGRPAARRRRVEDHRRRRR